MIDIGKQGRKALLQAVEENDLYLEGNIIKVISAENDQEFALYLTKANERDKEMRKKRLDMTKQVQLQNDELKKSQAEIMKKQGENETLMEDLKGALEQAQNAKKTAQNDLDHLQKKTQFELMGNIVKVALIIILGVGCITTMLYVVSIITGKETALIGTAWSSMFGILLTNSFSIIGTIMGVKYASEKGA